MLRLPTKVSFEGRESPEKMLRMNTKVNFNLEGRQSPETMLRLPTRKVSFEGRQSPETMLRLPTKVSFEGRESPDNSKDNLNQDTLNKKLNFDLEEELSSNSSSHN